MTTFVRFVHKPAIYYFLYSHWHMRSPHI